MFGRQNGSTRERPSERKLCRNLVCCFLIFLSSCHRYMNALEKQLGFQGQRAYGIPWNPAIRYGILTDARDGGTYRTAKIGEQTWMAQNLDYKVNGSWCLDRLEDSCRKYGRAYQWTTAMDIGRIYLDTNLGGLDGPYRGICPTGWHLPSDAEWGTLMATAYIRPYQRMAKEPTCRATGLKCHCRNSQVHGGFTSDLQGEIENCHDVSTQGIST